MNYTDQMMREVRMDHPPSRIISLVPSLTELLYDLGLEDEIAGITKFCIHPEKIFRTKQRVGGTKNVDHQKISEINPDLVIGNKEENTKADIELLEKKYPVWMSDVNSLEQAVDMISKLGAITHRSTEAAELIPEILSGFKTINKIPATKTVYLIWRNPFMAAGSDTFISDMLNRCGFENVVTTERYPTIDKETLQSLNPSIVLLSSEPYPFKEKHIEEIKSFLPNATISLVDGEYFSWYGSRLKGSPGYFNELINNLRNQNPATTVYEN